MSKFDIEFINAVGQLAEYWLKKRTIFSDQYCVVQVKDKDNTSFSWSCIESDSIKTLGEIVEFAYPGVTSGRFLVYRIHINSFGVIYLGELTIKKS